MSTSIDVNTPLSAPDALDASMPSRTSVKLAERRAVAHRERRQVVDAAVGAGCARHGATVCFRHTRGSLIIRAFSQAILLASLATLGLSACERTTVGGSVGVDRPQLMLVSSEQLDQLSAQSYAELQSDAKLKGTLNSDPALTRRVAAIARRMEPQTKVFRADAPGWSWEVNVITSSELNAFCMPGGRIMFYSGLITQLDLMDDEIAIVMGHEIAHALREHSREQVSQALAAKLGIGAGLALMGLDTNSADVVNAGYTALVATRFSRTDESEADRIGLELTARSGYDPRAA